MVVVNGIRNGIRALISFTKIIYNSTRIKLFLFLYGNTRKNKISLLAAYDIITVNDEQLFFPVSKHHIFMIFKLFLWRLLFIFSLFLSALQQERLYRTNTIRE